MTKSQLKKLKKKRAKERNEQESAKQPRLDQGVCVEENTTHSSEDETEELQWALENKMEELQRVQENIDELRSSLATEEATAAALATEAASIANTLLQTTTTTHSLKWTCEVCKTKRFDSYSDALEHEKSCTGHTVDAPASRTTMESSILRFEEKLAASEANFVELQRLLEQTKQSNQSIIGELESSK